MIPWISVVFIVISLFAFLILLIWVSSLLILVRFARGLSISFIFSKNQLFVSLILCMVFLFLFHFFSFNVYVWREAVTGSSCSQGSRCHDPPLKNASPPHVATVYNKHTGGGGYQAYLAPALCMFCLLSVVFPTSPMALI
jgi:hypothetical protein